VVSFVVVRIVPSQPSNRCVGRWIRHMKAYSIRMEISRIVCVYHVRHLSINHYPTGSNPSISQHQYSPRPRSSSDIEATWHCENEYQCSQTIDRRSRTVRQRLNAFNFFLVFSSESSIHDRLLGHARGQYHLRSHGDPKKGSHSRTVRLGRGVH